MDFVEKGGWEWEIDCLKWGQEVNSNDRVATSISMQNTSHNCLISLQWWCFEVSGCSESFCKTFWSPTRSNVMRFHMHI